MKNIVGTCNQHRLIFAILQHVPICGFCDSPQVWWNLISTFSQVHLDNSWSVNWITFVRIDNDTKKAGVGVNQLCLVSNFKIMKDRCVIKICEVRHILTFLKLWWIDLTDVCSLENLFLQL